MLTLSQATRFFGRLFLAVVALVALGLFVSAANAQETFDDPFYWLVYPEVDGADQATGRLIGHAFQTKAEAQTEVDSFSTGEAGGLRVFEVTSAGTFPVSTSTVCRTTIAGAPSASMPVPLADCGAACASTPYDGPAASLRFDCSGAACLCDQRLPASPLRAGTISQPVVDTCDPEYRFEAIGGYEKYPAGWVLLTC